MKATFAAREPNILMEAQPGDLFVPLGPDLVECVCAVRSVETLARGVHVAVPDSVSLDPDALRPVVVLACRVNNDESEYHPSGFQLYLSGATPISFLEQVEPAAFRERGGDKFLINIRVDSEDIEAALRGVRPDNAEPGTCIGGSPETRPCVGYPNDFEVQPILRSPICTGSPRLSPATTVEPTGVPISRL